MGSFGKSVFGQVYPAALVARNWRRLAQVDYYDIYVRQAGAPKAESKTRPSRPIKATATADPNLSLASP